MNTFFSPQPGPWGQPLNNVLTIIPILFKILVTALWGTADMVVVFWALSHQLENPK